MLKKIISTSAMSALLFAAASGADASTYDKRTFFTFNQPVTLPGVTLPAGTYMFRLADETTSRKVIQVANEKGTESYAMLLSIPLYRPDRPADSEIRFMETAAGAPAAVRAWWYAGETTGYEFIYSKEQRDALTRTAQKQPSPVVAELAANDAVAPEPAPEEVPPFEDPVTSPDRVNGEGIPAEGEPIAEIAQAPAQEPAPEPFPAERSSEPRQELPQTASPLALFLLTGLASASAGLRLLRKS